MYKIMDDAINYSMVTGDEDVDIYVDMFEDAVARFDAEFVYDKLEIKTIGNRDDLSITYSKSYIYTVHEMVDSDNRINSLSIMDIRTDVMITVSVANSIFGHTVYRYSYNDDIWVKFPDKTSIEQELSVYGLSAYLAGLTKLVNPYSEWADYRMFLKQPERPVVPVVPVDENATPVRAKFTMDAICKDSITPLMYDDVRVFRDKIAVLMDMLELAEKPDVCIEEQREYYSFHLQSDSYGFDVEDIKMYLLYISVEAYKKRMSYGPIRMYDTVITFQYKMCSSNDMYRVVYNVDDDTFSTSSDVDILSYLISYINIVIMIFNDKSEHTKGIGITEELDYALVTDDNEYIDYTELHKDLVDDILDRWNFSEFNTRSFPNRGRMKTIFVLEKPVNVTLLDFNEVLKIESLNFTTTNDDKEITTYIGYIKHDDLNTRVEISYFKKLGEVRCYPDKFKLCNNLTKQDAYKMESLVKVVDPYSICTASYFVANGTI